MNTFFSQSSCLALLIFATTFPTRVQAGVSVEKSDDGTYTATAEYRDDVRVTSTRSMDFSVEFNLDSGKKQTLKIKRQKNFREFLHARKIQKIIFKSILNESRDSFYEVVSIDFWPYSEEEDPIKVTVKHNRKEFFADIVFSEAGKKKLIILPSSKVPSYKFVKEQYFGYKILSYDGTKVNARHTKQLPLSYVLPTEIKLRYHYNPQYDSELVIQSVEYAEWEQKILSEEFPLKLSSRTYDNMLSRQKFNKYNPINFHSENILVALPKEQAKRTELIGKLGPMPAYHFKPAALNLAVHRPAVYLLDAIRMGAEVLEAEVDWTAAPNPKLKKAVTTHPFLDYYLLEFDFSKDFPFGKVIPSGGLSEPAKDGPDLPAEYISNFTAEEPEDIQFSRINGLETHPWACGSSVKHAGVFTLNLRKGSQPIQPIEVLATDCGYSALHKNLVGATLDQINHALHYQRPIASVLLSPNPRLTTEAVNGKFVFQNSKRINNTFKSKFFSSAYLVKELKFYPLESRLKASSELKLTTQILKEHRAIPSNHTIVSASMSRDDFENMLLPVSRIENLLDPLLDPEDVARLQAEADARKKQLLARKKMESAQRARRSGRWSGSSGIPRNSSGSGSNKSVKKKEESKPTSIAIKKAEKEENTRFHVPFVIQKNIHKLTNLTSKGSEVLALDIDWENIDEFSGLAVVTGVLLTDPLVDGSSVYLETGDI